MSGSNQDRGRHWTLYCSAYGANVVASVSRLRPVCLGAGTANLGVVLLLQDALWVPMVLTIMAGLIFGTILTMLVIPVFYAMLHRIPSPR